MSGPAMMSSEPWSLPSWSEPRSQVKCEDTELQPGPSADHPRLPQSKKHRAMSVEPGRAPHGALCLQITAHHHTNSLGGTGAGGNQLGPGPALSTSERPVFGSRDPSRPIRVAGMAGAGPIRGRDGGSLREKRWRPGPR